MIIKQTIIHTPWWAYLLFIGIKASKIRVVSIIFTWMSVKTLLTALKINTLSVGTWGIAILVGVTLGWLQIIRHKLVVDKPHWLVKRCQEVD